MWFCYDPENGIEFFETDSAAQLAAEKALDAAREVACDSGWEDNVNEICWGFVRAKVEEKHGSRRPADPESDFVEVFECELVPQEE